MAGGLALGTPVLAAAMLYLTTVPQKVSEHFSRQSPEYDQLVDRLEQAALG